MKDHLINYPKVDGPRKYFVKYPIELENGKWYAADVYLPKGNQPGTYQAFSEILHRQFDEQQECQRACDIHNSFHGWGKRHIRDIISFFHGDHE